MPKKKLNTRKKLLARALKLDLAMIIILTICCLCLIAVLGPVLYSEENTIVIMSFICFIVAVALTIIGGIYFIIKLFVDINRYSKLNKNIKKRSAKK